MNLFLIDGSGPFFGGYRRRRINWSKIPFDNLEDNGELDTARLRRIEEEFAALARTAAALGFNGVTLDDLAHLAPCPRYGRDLNARIARYREAFGRIFSIAADAGLGVYLTTDAVFEPAGRPGFMNPLTSRGLPFLARACGEILACFPQVRGVILRVGECDSRDVRGDFRSRLAVKTPRTLRRYIRTLLPAFERHRRTLIVRTWTVGAYALGDLIWNRNTFDRVFRGLDSKRLVLSMKYGETDFFRYLPLNKLFFRSDHRKLIELQTRREYEGFGEFPAFTGWDYEQYLRQLGGARNVVGAWIWCQTGGWSVFRRRTFLDRSAVWTEIDTRVAVRLWRHGETVEEAVQAVAAAMGCGKPDRLLALLRLSDEVVKQLLYIEDLARRKIFFRRVRVPPLLSVFWDQVLVNHSMRKLLRCLVTDPEESISQGYTALGKIRAMHRLAAELGLPARDIAFQYDTFHILALAREYYLGPYRPDLPKRLRSLKRAYIRKYPVRYAVNLDFSRFAIPRSRLRFLLSLFLREQRGYRLVDRLLMIRYLSLISPILLLTRHRGTRALLNSQAMGIHTVLK
ncbi:MAG: hypothetical protein JW951_01405 [Lentisphaerae bacterium]|nr:hypothetical protein [Lentisphaerota bacterium]